MRSALGISVGDIITTSYNTGPYEVAALRAPRYWYKGSQLVIRPYPVIGLSLKHYPTHSGSNAIINGVRRAEDGRYFSMNSDEIFVTKVEARELVQMGLFDDEDYAGKHPYRYQEGVNYQAGDGCVWHCEHCGKDFNTELRGYTTRDHCPACGSWPIPIIYITADDENDFLHYLRFPNPRKDQHESTLG